MDDFVQAKTLDKGPLYCGLSHAKLGERESAVAALTSFIENRPDEAMTPWLKELFVRLSSPPTGVKRALLIAIADYLAHPRVSNLQGPLNDLRMMRDVLTQWLGFPEQNITDLVDAKATKEGIINALRTLQTQAQPGDTVVVYYSGHAMNGSAPHTCWSTIRRSSHPAAWATRLTPKSCTRSSTPYLRGARPSFSTPIPPGSSSSWRWLRRTTPCSSLRHLTPTH